MAQPAAEQVEFGLVALHQELGGYRRAVDADRGRAVIRGLGLGRPSPDRERYHRLKRRRAELRLAIGDGVSEVGKAFRADRAEALRVDRLGHGAGLSHEPSGPKRIDLMTDHAGKTGGGDDLARTSASAAVEPRHQRPHAGPDAGRQKLMELRRVVPVWRRLPDIGTAALGQPDGDVGPSEGVRIIRQRRSKADLDSRSGLPVGGDALGDGGSVALRLKLQPQAPADDRERSARRQHRSRRNPKPTAERAPCRQPQHLGRGQRPRDGEQVRNLVRVEAGALILDEVAAVILAHRDRCAGVERVVGQFLQDQPDELVLRHASLLLQPFDGAEAGPIGALKFKILRVALA